MNDRRHRIRPRSNLRAKQLRAEATFPEKLLWGRLRSRRLLGLKFRRQHCIDSYVVDFYCAAANLVVEIDGRSHDGRVEYDKARSAHLAELGLCVVRYTNDEVLADLDVVAEDIARHCNRT